MGITIHYRGRLKPKETVRNAYISAKLVAQEKGWAISDFMSMQATLDFPKNPLQPQYQGPVVFFTLTAHEHCEPVHFHFTEDGYFEERCKTQFAPLEVHMG